MGVPFVEISAARSGALALVSGSGLVLEPGRELAARVLAVWSDGRMELAVAGGRLSARSDVPLEAGETLSLVAEGSRDDAVVLRLVSVAEARSEGPDDALLPASAARVLAAARAEAEGAAAAPAQGPAAPAAARAAEAGVRTPAQAAAFARLDAAGLPTTEAAVRGLAALVEDAPVGRALAAILAALGEGEGGESAIWRQGTASSGASARMANWQPGPAPTEGETANWQSRPMPSGTEAARANWHSPPAPNGTTVETANWQSAPAPNGIGTERANWQPPAPNGISPSEDPLANLASALAKLVAKVAGQAASGDADALRRAVTTLGHGAEARLAVGRAPQDGVRGALLAIATHPGAEGALATTTDRLADAIGAQALAAPSLATAPPPGTPGADGGAYLQLPLPGGQTVEVRVDPDAGGGTSDPARARKLAFLLHMSALGPVLVEATSGPGGVEATVKVISDPARTFCSDRAPDLATALEAVGARSARVSVERMNGPAPTRLLPPPPTSGLDVSA